MVLNVKILGLKINDRFRGGINIGVFTARVLGTYGSTGGVDILGRLKDNVDVKHYVCEKKWWLWI